MNVYKVTGVENRTSYHGGTFYHIFFKRDDGKSFLTHAYPTWQGKPIRNFSRWNNLINKYRAGEEVLITNIALKRDGMVDADSVFSYVRPPAPPSGSTGSPQVSPSQPPDPTCQRLV